MLELNYRRNFSYAHDLFMAAHALCAKKIDLDPSVSIVECDLFAPSWFHAALAAERDGKIDQAKRMYRGMLDTTENGLFRQHPDLLTRAREFCV
jgi:hypothetical protein